MKWFLVDTEIGDWIVNLDEVIFITASYSYDAGWNDEARCHNWQVHLHMRNGKEFEINLNQRGYEALIKELGIKRV
jgi:hypothetical protein